MGGYLRVSCSTKGGEMADYGSDNAALFVVRSPLRGNHKNRKINKKKLFDLHSGMLQGRVGFGFWGHVAGP